MHRYNQIILPLARYYQQLTPKSRAALNVLEIGLMAVLFASIVQYI